MIQVDEKDLLLLHLLEENSQITTQELAVMVGVEEEEAGGRIRRMEESRIIRKYTTIIDWERAGNGEVSAIIELKVNPERDFGYDRIAERIARFRQVRSVRLITGIYDIQLVVTGRSMGEIARFVSEQIAPMDRIRETATHIIMKSYKENGHIFFERGEPERLPYSL